MEEIQFNGFHQKLAPTRESVGSKKIEQQFQIKSFITVSL